MCNCKKDIEERLLDRFKAEAPQAQGYQAELQGYGIVISGNSLFSVPYMPFKTMAEFPLKKGGTKVKSQTRNMFFNYCPFCGEKIEKGGAA